MYGILFLYLGIKKYKMKLFAYIKKTVSSENLERCTFQVPKMVNGVYVLSSIFSPKMELYEKSSPKERLDKAIFNYDGLKELTPIMLRYNVKGKSGRILTKRKKFKTFDGFLKVLKKEL